MAAVGGLEGALLGEAVAAAVGGVAGVVWAFAAGVVGHRFAGQEVPRFVRNVPVFAGIVSIGLVFGAGLVGAIGFHAAAPELSRTVADSFHGPIADAQGVFFNIANGSTEWLILPAAVLLDWSTGGRRRVLVCWAAAVYYLARVWTYVYFGPHVVDFDQRLADSGGVLPPGMMADLERWAGLDLIRTGMDAVAYVLLLLAAFTTTALQRGRAR